MAQQKPFVNKPSSSINTLAKIILGCVVILAYALPMSASESEPTDNKSSEEVKNKQTNSNTNKNARLLPGPCAFAFIENCITGPYVTASFAMGSSEASGTSSNTDNYSLTGGSDTLKIDVTSNYNSKISNDSAYGADIGLGYDLGGLRAELIYNYSRTTSGNASINGENIYSLTVDDGDESFRRTIPLTSSTTSNSLHYSSQRIIASLAFDIPTGSRLSPYFSGGIGPAWVSVKSTTLNTLDPCAATTTFLCPSTFKSSGGTGFALALQAKAGLSYFMTPRTSLFVEAVYDYTSSASAGNIKLNSLGQYSAKFGFRSKF